MNREEVIITEFNLGNNLINTKTWREPLLKVT
jgi:hypothetical protein